MVDHWPKSYTLSEDEEKMIQDYRREKEAMQNEQSPNMKAVEDIERLKTYLKDNNITYENNPVDNALRCMKTRLSLIKEVTDELNSRQTISYMNEYQNAASETAIYPGKGTPLGLIYCALKLSGEAGEVAENVGKALRDEGLTDNNEMYADYLGFNNIWDSRRSKLKLELGDVLWYVSQAAKELDFSLEEIAQANLEKLTSRAKNGTLKGSGDDR